MATTNKNFKVKNGLDVNGEINVSAVGGDEGGQINLEKPATGTTLSGNVSIDIYQNRIRIFDAAGTNKGAYIDLSAATDGVGSNLLAGGGGTASNSFETISANGVSVVADSSTDTLTITPGDGFSILGNATSDTITFTPNVASASANGIVTTGTQTFAGEKTFSNTITANANIVANTGFVSADTFRLDTTYTGGSSQAGEIAWDPDEGTLMFQLKDGAVTHRIGQQMDVRVVNATGSTIPEGAVVYISGASGQEPRIALANAATEGASSKTIGVVTQQGGIANAASGYICTAGIMRGVDVGAYTSGTPLWLSNVAGVFTDTKPIAPDNGVFIGWVVKEGNAGSILVSIQNGYEVNELHDVKYTSLATNDILQRTANNLWENKTLAGANIANLAATGLQTFSGNIAAANISTSGLANVGQLTVGSTATFNKPDGSAPFIVVSTTQVTNLTAQFAGTANSVALANVTGLSTALDGKANLSGATFTGNIAGTNLALSGKDIFSNTGTGAPTFTTYSSGVRTVFYDNVGGTSVGYSRGIDAGVLWDSIPAADAGMYFKWYGGETQVASLSGAGIFATTTVNATTVNATTFNGSGAGLTSIPNSGLANSAITINGTSVSLGGSTTIAAESLSPFLLMGG